MTKNNNDNDKKLWEEETKKFNPLKGESRNLTKHEPPTAASSKGSVPGTSKMSPAKPSPPTFKPSPIDEYTFWSIVDGNTKIDRKIDLHKRTQDEAMLDLKKFLSAAHANKKKIVLVITGKGADSKGALKQNVPRWLEVAPLNRYVNGFRTAHGKHGGEGALYVRIRKE